MLIEMTLVAAMAVATPTELKKADAELYCMAQNIYFEAGNQSDAGKRAVGYVVLNRISDKRWPSTICGVIKQKYQFSWCADGKSDRVPNNKTFKSSLRAAIGVLYGTEEDITYGANHYHADYVNPRWRHGFKKTVKIGLHIFYTD